MQFLIALVLYCVAFGINFLVMIFGWGIVPQSWAVIIGGSLASLVIIGLAGAAVQSALDE